MVEFFGFEMGSFVGCYPLHSLSSSKCLQQHAQGGILPIAVPAPSGSLKQKHRRPVLASRSDGEMASLGNVKKMENSCTNRRAILALIALSASPVFTPRSFADEDPVAGPTTSYARSTCFQKHPMRARKCLRSFQANFQRDFWSFRVSEFRKHVKHHRIEVSDNIDRKDERLLGASRSQKPEIVAASPASQEPNVTTEFAGEGKSPVSTLFGFLNELGIVGSGVLGALFALERKERAAKESTVEAVVAELKERKVAMASLRESLEGKMLEEKNRYLKEARKAQEEQAFLSKELASANLVVRDLQKQLEGEKKMILALGEQAETLNTEITRVQNDNATLEIELMEKQSRLTDLEQKMELANANVEIKATEIENLRVTLSKREKQLEELSSNANKMRKSLLHADAQVEELKRENAIAKHDLGLKESSVKDLNERLASVVGEREEAKKKLFIMHEELNQMQLTSDKELASAREALFAKQEEVNQLKEKQEIALEEAEKNAGILTRLQEESATLNALLEKEKTSVKHLKGELQRLGESFEASRSKIVDLSSELTASKQMQAQLQSEITRLKIDSDATCSAMEQRLNEAEAISRRLSNELASVNKALDMSRDEQSLLNKKLKDSTASYENLKAEVSQVRKTAEASIAALNEEKKVAAALCQKLEASEKCLLEEKKDSRALQRDFEEAAKSVEDLRSCLMSLSEELELAKSKIDTLELEKASLYESLKAQKQLATEVQESAVHASKVLTKIGKEKETSVKRVRKLEEELSSAKGEILRLRKHITVMNAALEEAQLQKGNESQSKQFQDTANSPPDVSLQIESMQAELNQIQKKLGDADRSQLESEVATNSLHDAVTGEQVAEESFGSSCLNT